MYYFRWAEPCVLSLCLMQISAMLKSPMDLGRHNTFSNVFSVSNVFLLSRNKYFIFWVHSFISICAHQSHATQSRRIFWPVRASSQVLLWVCGTEEPENHSQSQERSGSLRRAASLHQHCIPGFSILCKYHLHGCHQVILIYVNSSEDSFLLKLTIVLVSESSFMTTSLTSGSKYAQ